MAVQGVNVEKLEEFRKFLEENPDKGWLNLEAKAVWEGHSGRSLVHMGPYEIDGERIDRATRHYTIPFGAWKEVEELSGIKGPTDRIEPVETALSALSACLTYSVGINAAREGIDLEGLEITVKSEVDPRVLYALKGPEEHPACLRSVRYEVKAGGNLSDEDLSRIQKLVEHSPVHGLIANANTITGGVQKD